VRSHWSTTMAYEDTTDVRERWRIPLQRGINLPQLELRESPNDGQHNFRSQDDGRSSQREQCSDRMGDNMYSREKFLPSEHSKTNTRQNYLLAKCVTKLIVHDEWPLTGKTIRVFIYTRGLFWTFQVQWLFYVHAIMFNIQKLCILPHGVYLCVCMDRRTISYYLAHTALTKLFLLSRGKVFSRRYDLHLYVKLGLNSAV
jgi:hypothetical protein